MLTLPWRFFWTTAHRWVGLTIACFLIVAGLTGAVTSWDHELDHWLNPRFYDTTGRGPTLSPLELAAAVEVADPRVVVNYLSVGTPAGESAGFFVRPNVDPATGRPFELDYNQVFVDPVTAAIVGRRDSRAISLSREALMPFLRNVHFRLVIPAFWGTDRWGYRLMGSVALLWLFDSFVGFYLTLPVRSRLPHASGEGRSRLRRWRPAWLVRWGAGGYKLAFDLHRAVGLWIWAILIVISFTSFSMNLFHEVFYPALSLVSKVTPDVESTRQSAPPGSIITPKLGFAEIMERGRAEAARRHWTTPMGGLFYDERHGFYNVSFFGREQEDGNGTMGLSNLYIDGADGRILGDNVPWKGSAADVFVQLQFPLHSGRILGLPGRILMSAMGVIVAVLSMTGIAIWARKRRGRRARRRADARTKSADDQRCTVRMPASS